MDEVQRLLLNIEGKEKLDALNVALAKEQEFLLKLLEIQKQGVVGVNPATIQQAAEKVIALNREIAAAERGTKDFSRSALQLSYVLDDLSNTSGSWTQKLASISNNIPGLVMSLGLTGGVAGAIGLISTGLIALAPLAKKAMESFTGPEALPQVKVLLDDAAERVKGLQHELNKLMQSRPMAEKRTAEEVEFIIGEGGPANLIRGIAAGMGAAGEGAPRTAGENKRIRLAQERLTALEASRGKMPAAAYEMERANAMADLRGAQFDANSRTTAETERMAGEMLAGAPTSAAARRRIGRYLPGLGAQFADVEPEALRAFDADVAAQAEDAEGAKGSRVERQAKAVAAAKAMREERKRVAQDQDDVAEGLNMARKAEAEARKKEARFDADQARDADQAEASEALRRPRNRARAGILAAGAEMGLPAMFTPEQVNQMADQVVGLGKQGVDTNTAIMSALMGKVQALQRLKQQLQSQQQWANGLNMGGDNSGDFSAMPSMYNMGYGG